MVFLSARWEKLIMANYVVDPAILLPYVPAGTELDFWEDKAYVSLVGFLFLKTRVLGLPIPFHRNFEEVNLRFYVRQNTGEGWRRGVVFIKEIVPKSAIALLARMVYGEPYIRLPMEHSIDGHADGLHATYRWRYRRDWNHIGVVADPIPVPMPPLSEEAFITEHYWGYTRLNARRTSVYQVEHPVWRIYPVRQYDISCSFRSLYGDDFAALEAKEPASVLFAEGSDIQVLSGSPLRV